jgi:hypothetical protein
VLVVVALDQFAVDHLFATARAGYILAEIRVRAAEIAKQWQRLVSVRYFLFRRHYVLKSACNGSLFPTPIMGIWI